MVFLGVLGVFFCLFFSGFGGVLGVFFWCVLRVGFGRAEKRCDGAELLPFLHSCGYGSKPKRTSGKHQNRQLSGRVVLSSKTCHYPRTNPKMPRTTTKNAQTTRKQISLKASKSQRQENPQKAVSKEYSPNERRHAGALFRAMLDVLRTVHYDRETGWNRRWRWHDQVVFDLDSFWQLFWGEMIYLLVGWFLVVFGWSMVFLFGICLAVW